LGNIAGEIGERALNLKEKTYIIGYGFASDEEFDKLVAEGKIGQDEDTKVFHYIG